MPPPNQTIEYTTTDESSQIELGKEVTKITHNGVELLAEVKKLRAESECRKAVREKQDQILTKIRETQKKMTMWQRLVGGYLVIVALICTCLATWVVNRLVHLPKDTTAFMQMIESTHPRLYHVNQIVNYKAQPHRVLYAHKSPFSWMYKLQEVKSVNGQYVDTEMKPTYKRESALTPVIRKDGNFIYVTKVAENSPQSHQPTAAADI